MIIDITNDFSIDIGNGTDVGKVRQKNEDYLESFESPFGYVFVVCDGMGGHTAGEVASRLAVATIKENILNNPQGVTNTKQIIIDSVNLANHRIIEKWTDEPELKGMGTTAVVLIVKTNIAYYAHVGDSRMYMIRNSKIYQMTRDHSFVQTLVDGGLISYEEAEHHPRKNEIMQALGITTEIKVDVNNIGLNLYKNDTFIMCSDGLSGLMTDEDIQRIVNTNDPQEASLKLISTANNNGGFDNITVQVVKVVKGLSLPKGKEDVVPLGALDKKVIGIKQNTFKPHSFDKTAEIPAFSNIQAKEKSRTMLYVLLAVLILIFTGLIYYVKTSKDNPVESVDKNPQKTKIEETQKEISEFFQKILMNDSTQEYKGKKLTIIIFAFVDLKQKEMPNWNISETKKYLKDNKFSNDAKNTIICEPVLTKKDTTFVVELDFGKKVYANIIGNFYEDKFVVNKIDLYSNIKNDNNTELKIGTREFNEGEGKIKENRKPKDKRGQNVPKEKKQSDEKTEEPKKDLENNTVKQKKKGVR